MKKINLIRSEFDNEEREYFQCDCHDRDHTIYAVHDKTKDDTGEIIYEDIALRFVASRHDAEICYSDHACINFFRRMMWRVKMAIRILIDGMFEYDGEWVPERRAAERVRGKKDLRKLIEWLAKRDLEIEEREMKARELSPDELSERKEFAKKWGWYSIED